MLLSRAPVQDSERSDRFAKDPKRGTIIRLQIHLSIIHSASDFEHLDAGASRRPDAEQSV